MSLLMHLPCAMRSVLTQCWLSVESYHFHGSRSAPEHAQDQHTPMKREMHASATGHPAAAADHAACYSVQRHGHELVQAGLIGLQRYIYAVAQNTDRSNFDMRSPTAYVAAAVIWFLHQPKTFGKVLWLLPSAGWCRWQAQCALCTVPLAAASPACSWQSYITCWRSEASRAVPSRAAGSCCQHTPTLLSTAS